MIKAVLFDLDGTLLPMNEDEFKKVYFGAVYNKVKHFGYKPEELLDGFNDAVELTHYSGNRAHKKKWVQIVFLL